MTLQARKKQYFNDGEGVPEPLKISVKKRVQFGQVDALAIVWHGRYPEFFEAANSELCRKIGLSYEDMYRENVGAPIAQLHVDYKSPLMLSEEFTTEAAIHWDEGAKLNIEYKITAQDERLICTAYTVQLFIDLKTREPLWVSPELLENFRIRWRNGEFSKL